MPSINIKISELDDRANLYSGSFHYEKSPSFNMVRPLMPKLITS